VGGGAIADVGLGAVLVVECRDVDFDRSFCLLGKWAGDRGLDGLAADHEEFIGVQNRDCCPEGVVEFGPSHAAFSSAAKRR